MFDYTQCTICSGKPPLKRNCPHCGEALPFPNVRSLSSSNSLDTRYEAARSKASQAKKQSLDAFEEAVKKSFAVINVKIDFLYSFVTQQSNLYSTYQLQLRGNLRTPANPAEDRHRFGVDGTLFGSFGEEIRYAALSIDGNGLTSFGNYSIRLMNEAIAHRATLLEADSYLFVDEHDLHPGDDIPAGYQSSWDDRHKLTVAKLAERIAENTPETDFAQILLYSEGNHDTDAFIEVHIYGAFSFKIVCAVQVSKSAIQKKDRVHKALHAAVKDIVKKQGKTWNEQ